MQKLIMRNLPTGLRPFDVGGVLNIWLVNHYAIPPSQAGITRHYAFARELLRRGHHVTIVASSFDHVTRRETWLEGGGRWRFEVVEGVPFLWIRTPPYEGNSLARVRNILSFAWSVGSRLAGQGFERPDLILGSSPTLFAALAAQRLAARWCVPFVLEVRDLWPESLVALGKVSRGHPLVKVLEGVESYLYRKASGIITLLPNAKRYIADKGGPPDKVFWVPNGVDFSLFPLPEPPLCSSPFRLMYAGSHGFANGLDTILDAAAILQQQGLADHFVFRMVGDGPQKARLVERARKEKLENVEFFEPVPKKGINGLLAGADAFIATLRASEVYRYGTSLNKIYDFLAAGRPIVFGATGEGDPVSESGAGLVVPPEDPAAMAEAVKVLASKSSEERFEMGRKGRLYVEKHFDIAALCATMEKVFREALRADEGPPRR